MMNKPTLGICIASYNKAETTYDLVNNVLSNKNEELSVTVVDNASTDNTIELLSTIRDNRFRLIVNDQNIGGGANMVKSIYSCDATFGLYCNDRDIIYPDKLDSFIRFLNEHDEIAGGWIVRNEKIGEPEFKEYDTLESLHTLNYRCEHPTGFFYNCEFLKRIESSRMYEYATEKKYVPFPWENMLAEMTFIGKTVRYNRKLWHSTGDSSHNEYISSYVPLNNSNDRWFSPSNSIERAKGNVDHLYSLIDSYNVKINKEDMTCLLAEILSAQLKIGIWRYVRILESESLAYHYSVKMEKISFHKARRINDDMIHHYLAFLNSKYNIDEVSLKKISDIAWRVFKQGKRNEIAWKLNNSNVIASFRGIIKGKK